MEYVLRTRAFAEKCAGVARGMGTAFLRVNTSDLLSLSVLLPDVATQVSVASYLDTETVRIDSLIEKKRRMVELLEEKAQASLLNVVGDWRSGGAWSLRQSGTTVVTGPFGTQLAAAEYVEDGIPVINPTHITHTGHLAPDSQVSVTEVVATRLARHRLRRGDVILGRKGDVGRSAVVNAEQEGWVCGSDAIAVRTDPGRLNPEFLAMVLHLSLYRQQLDAASTGAMMANLNEHALLEFRLPRLYLPVQDEALAQMVAATLGQRRMSARLRASTDLLVEHRQALVTAAVTGELEIPGVAA